MKKWKFHALSTAALSQGMRHGRKTGGGQDKRVTNESGAA